MTYVKPNRKSDAVTAIDMNGVPLGPFKLGRHVLNYAARPWAWFDGENFRGPMCRTRRGCRFAHWRRSR